MTKPGGMPLPQMLFGFDGRIRRRDFWLWSFANLAAGLTVIGVAGVLAILTVAYTQSYRYFFGLSVAAVIAMVPFGWVIMALQVKRQHDIGHSMQRLVNFIPFLGWIWVIGECYLREGMAGDNAYGPSPKVLK